MTAPAGEMLRKHPILIDLPRPVQDAIVGACTTRKLAQGEPLFLKDDPGDCLYGVISGLIRISTTSPTGKEITINILRAGEIFGEIALLDGQPRTADATAMSDAELLTLQRRDFLPVMEREPKLFMHVVALLCVRLRRTMELLEDTAFLPIPGRLAKSLLALANLGDNRLDGRIRLRTSQQALGQQLGASRETVNKILQEWRAKQWIELSREHIELRDRAALERFVQHLDRVEL